MVELLRGLKAPTIETLRGCGYKSPLAFAVISDWGVRRVIYSLPWSVHLPTGCVMLRLNLHAMLVLLLDERMALV